MSKLRFITALLATLVLAGCTTTSAQPESEAEMSAEDKQGVIAACSPVYGLDWKNVSFEKMPEIANDFVAIKNSSVAFGESARAQVEKVAGLVSEMDALYDDMNSYVKYELDFDAPNWEEESSARDDEFQAGREEISAKIAELCAPFFE